MGSLVAVIGNSGVGKTTLARALAGSAGFTAGLEQHEERPFQRQFARQHRRYALPNQVDYLLLRAEQERALRAKPAVGVQDGGLDLDYHLFTRRFFQKGYLNPDEFALCRRLYGLLRELQPPPEVFVYLKAPREVIEQRYRGRGKVLRIATIEDLDALQALLDEWLDSLSGSRLVTVEAGQDDPGFQAALPGILARIQAVLRETG